MSSLPPVPRRLFLRGLGTAVALPVLQSVLPARLRAAATNPANQPQRVAWIYVPNGANMADWTPATTGTDYALPSSLQPLAAHQRDLTVLTGLANPQGDELGDGGGAHARASASFLSGVHPRKTAGADIQAGISCDQIAARQIGHQTRLPSLELSCDGGQRAGSCDSGYSCIYQFNVSWRSATQPMAPEVNPRAAFERLFGNGDAAASVESAARRSLYRRSILDYVLDDAQRLEARLGVDDRRKLDEYLTSVRELEVRIARADQFPMPDVPTGVDAPGMFETYEEHMELMYEVMALAFQTDSTRIATFIVAHDGSNRPYPNIGIRDGHHDLSHHRSDEEKKKKLAQINRYHVSRFSRFLDRLKSIPEGEGNLLNHSTILYGSALSDGNEHSPVNLPILLAGQGGGRLNAGRHVRVEEGAPMTNLYRSMLDTVGVSTETIGDSTGKLDAVFKA
ncbi:DUF1552 domain-containing protein [Synoicihabitans lomoniglobus]|uniref:DUF1552 domain-containing protein n=1 Tax=Synoicihabitans lomoniglobus TaxID=2909285 RepID=A0AAF0CNC7_9BACT|nr:DUF1552 domain-containing protein [Opitutaceae bacterium LMO-M01]WED64265.1 DUF1552 domain-containing protein [Opitutaceae bacterium LMO-M01]